MPTRALGDPYQGFGESYWELKEATFKISFFHFNSGGNSLESTNLDEELKLSSLT